MKANDVINEISLDEAVIAYQEGIIKAVKEYSWFRRVIIEPILKPIIEKILAEYAEVIIRATLDLLIRRGKI